MNYNGLSTKEVEESRKQYGSNALTKIKQKTFWKLFLESLGDPIIKILLIALCIKLLFMFSEYDVFETIGIFIAVMLASLISTISEYGSEEAFKRLQNEGMKKLCKVWRNNRLEEISIDDVVVNDIVVLSSGDAVCADGVLINGTVSVDESSLTGESKEIKKIINSKVLRGSVVVNGYAKMLVKVVGDKTLYGGISKEIQSSVPTSPLKIRLYGLAKIISKIGYIGAAVVTLSYLFNVIIIQNNFEMERIIETVTSFDMMFEYLLYALTLSVTIIIVAVPEGLPMMITLVLSSNMKRMLKDNVLVRKLTGIETSGNLNVLLTDKTGTLTKGILEVSAFISGDLKYFKKESMIPSKIKQIIYESFMINNECVISRDNIIGGNQTDKALIKFFKPNNLNPKVLKKVPFNSNDKYSKVVLPDYTLIKGASEVLLPHCKYVMDSNGIISEFNYLKVEKELDKLTKRGSRVIALAKSDDEQNRDLTFLGFVSIEDELRSEAKEGIRLIEKAGIDIIMITGDAKETAHTIASNLGLIKRSSDLVLTSDEFNRLSDEEVKKKLKNLKVVARALPSDKSRLVSIIEEMSLIVGMTGDGVNDAPALKKANVGFAMGSGTEVAKEASDIVILDNNILSISKAILYGRTTFKSIRKFICYQLTVNMTALTLSIVGSYIGISTPITIIQMLWLNMIMDTFAGLAFSFEPPLKYYMEEKPKEISEPIINRYMFSQIAFLAIYSSLLCIFFLKSPLILNFVRSDPKTFMTAYFALFIFIGICNSYNARSERLNVFGNLRRNKVFILISIFIIVVQIYLIYHGGELFRTYGLYIRELLFVVILSLTVIPADFIRKLILKKKGIKVEL